MITGRLSLIADPAYVDKLRRRAKQKFGAATKVVQIRPKAFAMWLLIDNETIWQRPLVGGSLKRIPLQIMTTRRQKGKVVEATLITTMTWTEKVRPLAAKLIFDWQALIKQLQSELNVTTFLTEQTLKKIAKQALATEMIMLEMQADTTQPDSQVRVIEWIVAEMRQKLLETTDKPVEDQSAMQEANPESNALLFWSVSYRMRESVRTESLSSELNLNVTSYRERIETVVSKVSIPF
ncbi:hypothetical protein THIOM_005261 [Candidatus Thiomargarita nelsonii]|uniref:Uncharacterized protein n=1 Tax=Candidatus Thiomargarita nelsonii TaxID=1003181 RepID=A0A176RTP4_9GAMM|nr:hypothetical protein THIOM_005261 [Candidatus Thiomargarita nelsonii]